MRGLSKVELTEKSLSSLIDNFKLSLLESDVALTVADEICDRLKHRLTGMTVGRFEDKQRVIKEALRDTLLAVLTPEINVDLVSLIEENKKRGDTTRILFVGFNGVGKTLTVAKVAKYLLDRGFSVVLACSDTRRAGAIEQLEGYAKRLGVTLIKRPYGSDAASVAFDAIEHAKARKVDVVLIDTAGRAETNVALMRQMEKIERVSSPHLVIFVGDALSGNAIVEQVKEFGRFVSVGASILAKADADVRGGAAVSTTFVTGKPVLFLGVGQDYNDLMAFDPRDVVKKMIGE